jgi:hypothetical protein
MDILSGDISALVFRRAPSKDLGEFSLDSAMLGLLVELDGKRSLAVIARKMGLDAGTLKRVILRLLTMRLVEPVGRRVSPLSNDFFEYLSAELSLALGPIAGVLIEEAVHDLGQARSEFSRRRAPELVDLLARQIQREDKRLTFKRNMVEKLKEMGTA